MTKRLFAIAILTVVSAICISPAVSSQPAPRRVEVHAKRWGFEPHEITLKKGEPVLLVLTSEDVPHGLRFRQLNVEAKAPKGGSAQVQFTPQLAGDFIGHCSVFCGSGHGSMTFTLHVVE